MQPFKKYAYSTSGVILLIVALVSINVIAGRLYGRLDVTDSHIYTLSEGSLNIAKGLTGDVQAKLYFSRSAKDVPVVFKTYAKRVEEVLREYAAHSGGHMTVEVIDPEPDTDEEEWARKYGIQAVNLQDGSPLYFGVVFLAGDKEIAVPYLDPRKEEFLEYDLAENLVKLKTSAKPKLGLLAGLDLKAAAAPDSFSGQARDWIIVSALENSFDVTRVETNVAEIPADLDVLLVVHPKNLEAKTLYAIDQYLLKGGELIVAVDPFSRMELATKGGALLASGQMPSASSDLGPLFKAWGLTYDPGKIVGDPLNATRINAVGENLSYPFFITLGKESFSTKSKITAHLKQMIIAEGGAIALAESSPYKMEPLLSTSADTGVQDAAMANYLRPADLAADLKTDGKQRVLAGLLTGKFKSAYPDGPPEGVEAKEHKKEADQEGAVLVIADVDFMHDSNAVDLMRFGPQTIVRPRNDNLNFIVNAADFLGGSQDLIAIRSSGKVARPFTKVLELQKEAQGKWKAEEERLSKELSGLQQKLNELQAQRTDGNVATLTPEQQAEIKRFRDEEVDVRRRRREVRKNLREDIEKLGHRLVAANMLAVPLIVSGFGIGVFMRRSRRTRKEKTNAK